MNERKKGSMLLEAIVAIAIASIAIIISVRLYVFVRKSVESEYVNYSNLQSINAVCNEVKYNIKFEKLEKILKDEDIILKYDLDFLDRLLEKELLNLTGDSKDIDNIDIHLINSSKAILNIRITLNFESKSIVENIEKGIWMDYV